MSPLLRSLLFHHRSENNKVGGAYIKACSCTVCPLVGAATSEFFILSYLCGSIKTGFFSLFIHMNMLIKSPISTISL